MYEEMEGTPNVAARPAVESSAQVGDLMIALAKAQAEMANAETDSTNYFRKRYSSLAATRDATVPVLARHGIAVTQFQDGAEAGWTGCITILWYENQYVKSTVRCRVIRSERGGAPIPIEALTHIDYTAVFSYLKRAALKAICGIADDADEEEERTGGRSDGYERSGTIVRPATPRREETVSAATPATDPRQVLLKEIEARCERYISPRKHTGMHKAIYYASFHVQTPGHIQTQPLEVLEAGISLYRHLTERVPTWERKVIDPDAWIAEQQREIAHEVDAALQEDPPDGVDPETGEDHRLDVALGWATPDERKAYAAEERQAHDEQQALTE
jgi:hypothetical protein